jgi:hypothetical protein
LQKTTSPLQQHFYGISHLELHTLKLYLYGKYSIQTMIFWSLCAFIWFKNIEKMLLQMTSGFLQLESTKLGTGCKDTLVICNRIFFHISEPKKGTKGPENHSLG